MGRSGCGGGVIPRLCCEVGEGASSGSASVYAWVGGSEVPDGSVEGQAVVDVGGSRVVKGLACVGEELELDREPV